MSAAPGAPRRQIESATVGRELEVDRNHVRWSDRAVTFWETAFIGIFGFLFGGLYTRSRERARLDEEALAGLRKVRVDAVVDVLKAVGRQYRATISMFTAAEEYEREKSDAAGQKMLDLAAQRLAATRETNDVAFTNIVLVPPAVRLAITRHLGALAEAESPQAAQTAVEGIAHALEEYLPPISRYQPFWAIRRRS